MLVLQLEQAWTENVPVMIAESIQFLSFFHVLFYQCFIFLIFYSTLLPYFCRQSPRQQKVVLRKGWSGLLGSPQVYHFTIYLWLRGLGFSTHINLDPKYNPVLA